MNKFALACFCLILYYCNTIGGCFAQQKISNLIFNSTDNVTGLNFNINSAPEIFYTNKKVSSTIGEGIAHAENNKGEIIFWVNSGGVFDQNQQLMPGSEGIFAHPSSTEITVCPFPDNPSLYYVFYNNQLCSGLYYSVVDMNKRNGSGEVVSLNIPVSPGINFAEGLEIIRIPCSRNYWLIANECGKGLRKYKIDGDGISGGEIFGSYPVDFEGRGELDYHNGKIGYAITFKNEAYFVDFNPETGESSNSQTIKFPSMNGAYGLEFSPDSKKVYVTDISNRDIFGNFSGSNLFSYDFNTREIKSWSIINDHPDCPAQMEGLGQVESGKDGKLYISQINGCQIVVVENPESEEPAIKKINVNAVLSAGISDHIQTDFLDEDLLTDAAIMTDGEPFLCSGDEKMLFTPGRTGNRQFQWHKNGVPLAKENNDSLKVKEAGNYTLLISNNSNCTAFSNEIKIEDRKIPTLDFQEKYTGCRGESLLLTLNIPDLEVSWSDGTSGPSVSVQESGLYEFKVDNGYCSQTGSIEVVLHEQEALKVPNVITPNGDEHNEYFIISGAAENISLFIYNRWGRLVFYSPEYKNNWNGEGLHKGTYYYKVAPQSSCSQPQKGWLMIL